jgi:hypothetical protein
MENGYEAKKLPRLLSVTNKFKKRDIIQPNDTLREWSNYLSKQGEDSATIREQTSTKRKRTVISQQTLPLNQQEHTVEREQENEQNNHSREQAQAENAATINERPLKKRRITSQRESPADLERNSDQEQENEQEDSEEEQPTGNSQEQTQERATEALVIEEVLQNNKTPMRHGHQRQYNFTLTEKLKYLPTQKVLRFSTLNCLFDQ